MSKKSEGYIEKEQERRSSLEFGRKKAKRESLFLKKEVKNLKNMRILYLSREHRI